MKKYNKIIFGVLSLGIVFAPWSVEALKKNEMVYTKLGYDGQVMRTNVTNHLSFVGIRDVEDETELERVMNLSGNETFDQVGNKITWNSRGNDIFYSGIVEKNMPIETEIHYYVDDEEFEIDEMLGKSGHIKIEYRFTNKEKNYVNVNGHTEVVYTPFVTSVGTIIPSGSKNVRVTSGKVVSTGTRTIVIGMASPGLYASTKFEELAGLDKTVVEFETDSFELGTTYIVSSPKFLDELDAGIFAKVDTLAGSVSELKTNMQKLMEGAKKLESGSTQLATGSNSLMESLLQLRVATNKLENGTSSLVTGIDTMITELNAVKAGLSNPTYSLELAQMSVLMKKNEEAIEKYGAALVMNGLDLNMVEAACAGTGSTDLLADVNVSTFCLLNANNRALGSVVPLLSNNIDAVLTGLSELKAGASSLAAGVAQADVGVGKIYEGSKALVNGSNELKVGAGTLSTGTITFKEKGIDVLAATTDKLVTYSDRLEAIAKLSKDYRGFASKNSDETIFVAQVASSKRK